MKFSSKQLTDGRWGISPKSLLLGSNLLVSSLLLSVMVMGVLLELVAAQTIPTPEPTANLEAPPSTVSGMNWWLPSNVKQTPGFGIGWVSPSWVKAWESYFPSSAPADEVHFSKYVMFQWHDLNPAPGVYDWSSLDAAIEAVLATPHLGFQLYPSLESRMVESPGYPGGHTLARYAVPHWLETKGYKGKKVTFTSCGDPVYWDPNSGYLDALEEFMTKLGNHVVGGYALKDHPRLQSLEMRANDYKWGEGQRRCSESEWSKNGYTSERYVAAQKRMIDIYQNAFPGNRGRLVLLTLDDNAIDDFYEPWRYAMDKGWGLRDGQLEVWMRYTELGWGTYYDEATQHLKVAEDWHPSIATNAVMSTELETIGKDDSGYGPIERTEIHHYVSTLRALQARRNWLYYGSRSYLYDIPSTRVLTRYAQLSAGKTRLDSPDAWVWLRQTNSNARYFHYTRDIPLFPNIPVHSGSITVKNFERWLEQHDVGPDGMTVPVNYWLKNVYEGDWDGSTRNYNTVWKQWPQAALSGNKEQWARRTDTGSGQNSMYFKIDNAWFNSYQGRAKLLVSYMDKNGSTWKVEYDDKNGTRRQTPAVTTTTGTGKTLKTVTFDLAEGIQAGGRFSGSNDFRLVRTAGGDTVVHFVRLVKDSSAKSDAD